MRLGRAALKPAQAADAVAGGRRPQRRRQAIRQQSYAAFFQTL
ncbi:hypothetical protein N9087_01440 [bacterium]|nr:hypothetical protein [bacterium]